MEKLSVTELLAVFSGKLGICCFGFGAFFVVLFFFRLSALYNVYLKLVLLLFSFTITGNQSFLHPLSSVYKTVINTSKFIWSTSVFIQFPLQ